jgi:hypothetical protein
VLSSPQDTDLNEGRLDALAGLKKDSFLILADPKVEEVVHPRDADRQARGDFRGRVTQTAGSRGRYWEGR